MPPKTSDTQAKLPLVSVFYDGECGLCQHSVRWLLRADATGEHFRFAPLGGQRFSEVFGAEQQARLPDSLVIRTAQAQTLVRAAAVAHLLQRLGGVWGLLGRMLDTLPRFLADGLYGLVARCRKHLFKRPPNACPSGPPEWARRFDR